MIMRLSQCDHPVILCMVGDHAPSLIEQLEGKRDMTPEEMELWQRAVPFVVWANFDYNMDGISEYASMTDLIPMMLSSAEMPLTPFYRQVLNVNQAFPVRTSSGLYMDVKGTIAHFDNEDYSNDEIKQYFFMEYNELCCGKDYIPNLFQIP